MLKNKIEIENWLNSMEIKNYTINDDLTVNVNGGVDISYKKLNKIPVQFNIVKGNFVCNGNNLTSLKGSPLEVYGDFDCYFNKLNNLKYLPNIVTGLFDYFSNPNIDLPPDLTLQEVHLYYLHKNLTDTLPINNKTNKTLKI